MSQDLLTRQQAADLLGVGKQRIIRYIKQGTLSDVRWPGSSGKETSFVPAAEVQEILDGVRKTKCKAGLHDEGPDTDALGRCILCVAARMRRRLREDGYLRCCGCRDFYPPEEFRKDANSWSGRGTRCRKCRSKPGCVLRDDLPPGEWITLKAAANLAGWSRPTMRKAGDLGLVDQVPVRGRSPRGVVYLVERGSVERFLEARDKAREIAPELSARIASGEPVRLCNRGLHEMEAGNIDGRNRCKACFTVFGKEQPVATIVNGLKRCTWCFRWKPVEEFSNSNQTSTGKACHCRECVNTIRGRKDKHKARLRRHGLTVGEFDAIHASQGGKCLGCGVQLEPNGSTAVDHLHSCCPGPSRGCGNCVRALLCGNCNLILGLAKDAEETLRNLADLVAQSPTPAQVVLAAHRAEVAS